MKPFIDQRVKSRVFLLGIVLVAISLTGLAFQNSPALAQSSPLHPNFPLLDSEGVNVLESGSPVSTMQTCGSCHDTAFIAEHSFHTTLGLDGFGDPGSAASERTWDTSDGAFGKWDPITYRYLSPEGDERIDLTTAEWIQVFGSRHVGGGPAELSRDGTPLAALAPQASDPETAILDPENGDLIPWDWEQSGSVEMNCFLCHYDQPNNEARIAALQDGQFGWANTATLLGTGIVSQAAEGWSWNPEAFDPNGELADAYLKIQDPDNESCGQCHGLVHTDDQDPITFSSCQPDAGRSTLTTGQVISAQRISASGLNLADKEELSRSWDIHTERLVECTDCHFSPNNPVYFESTDESSPDHLQFDPRRLEFGEYLLQPVHDFARGQSAQNTAAPELDDSMRRCESCHDAEKTHGWLPYSDLHMEAINCETCHIPQLYAPAYRQVDWTVITTAAQPATECRGLEGEPGSVQSLISGFQPAVLLREDLAGDVKFSPYNLVSAWFWVSGDPPRPVRLIDLEAAWLDEDGGYHPEVITAFDQNGDGIIDQSELALDTEEKQALIAGRLAALGLDNPRITGEVQPYSINHDVANGEWATRDCQTCHSDQSKLTQAALLSDHVPGGVLPEFVGGTNIFTGGEFYTSDDGALYFQPAPEELGLYIIGRDAVSWVDWFGVIAFLGTLGGVTLHGGLRWYASLRRPRHQAKLEKIYLYTPYERLWHWLQTFAILLLVFTGLIIHKPSMFGLFSFRYVVQVHNALGFLLLANAALALFYNLASGDIKRFIPQPQGFFNQAVSQTMYYLRGIFRDEEHPFEKTRQSRLNPLQKVTYLGILNVFLPLQILTGVLMWGTQRWPETAARLGGLAFLSPFHTLVAWSFASFIVLHVYLTTTGHTPLAGIKSMIDGWDEVEIHTPTPEETP